MNRERFDRNWILKNEFDQWNFKRFPLFEKNPLHPKYIYIYLICIVCQEEHTEQITNNEIESGAKNPICRVLHSKWQDAWQNNIIENCIVCSMHRVHWACCLFKISVMKVIWYVLFVCKDFKEKNLGEMWLLYRSKCIQAPKVSWNSMKIRSRHAPKCISWHSGHMCLSQYAQNQISLCTWRVKHVESNGIFVCFHVANMKWVNQFDRRRLLKNWTRQMKYTCFAPSLYVQNWHRWTV